MEQTAGEKHSRQHSRFGRALRFCRDNPATVGVLAIGLVGGAVAGAFVPIDRPLELRVLGGALIGLFFGMCPLGSRLFD